MSEKKGFHIEIDRSDIISIIALLMSLGTIFITMKQTGIMREQQQIMASQQKVPIWPNLFAGHSLMKNNNETELKGVFVNKGVGPAKIKEMKVTMEGVSILDYDQFTRFLKNKYATDSVSVSTSFGNFSGVFVSAEESMDFMSIKLRTDNGKLKDLFDLDIKTEVCYCSILDECWTISSDDPRNPKDCCQIN